MSTFPKFRIDVNIHSLLMNSGSDGPQPTVDKGMTLPEPVYPRFPEKLSDPGPETPPDHRDWTLPQAYHKMKGWLFPYVRSRVLPGEFHPITAYLLWSTSATWIAGTAGARQWNGEANCEHAGDRAGSLGRSAFRRVELPGGAE